ncbi:SET domain-containing protein [Teratosphaeria nubilosa]|uniref:SET domain-containing protein n=1 Tax=Teratosphaeria nubilosa TaxID=161662 RepID=A0A6G1LLV2_9PEZI|nr:SET domain-containing protein [Teratosphaeria nubilosa]
MGPPISDSFDVHDIPNAGRGVVAKQDLPARTVLLDSERPYAHVIFRQYRKEVCAHCFDYDRGRTLPVRDSNTGKVFCSQSCQVNWTDDQGLPGIQAWQQLHSFTQSRSRFFKDIDSIPPSTSRPNRIVVDGAWAKADHARLHTQNANRKSKSSQRQAIDPDILGLLLSAIIFYHNHRQEWDGEVLALAMDSEPYRSQEDLDQHCASYLQLATILPSDLMPSCTSQVCRTIVEAGSHNAFGIRAGGEDGEEYMGYAVYPSASYFNHSCAPNLVKRREGRTWRFMAGRDVRKGEQLCITYLGGDEKDLELDERRRRLRDAWGFECMCERCKEEQGAQGVS